MADMAEASQASGPPSRWSVAEAAEVVTVEVATVVEEWEVAAQGVGAMVLVAQVVGKQAAVGSAAAAAERAPAARAAVVWAAAEEATTDEEVERAARAGMVVAEAFAGLDDAKLDGREHSHRCRWLLLRRAFASRANVPSLSAL
mgnify:CR=1 FL=1